MTITIEIECMSEAPKSYETPYKQNPEISDPAAAQEYIYELWKRGERPVVTVPVAYVGTLKKGLRAHTTWIPNFKVIAGTMGRDPYLPPTDKRVIVTVDVPPEQIKPRFTGPDKSFHGVVILEGPIDPERITIHEQNLLHR